jgi:hypothetical protein
VTSHVNSTPRRALDRQTTCPAQGEGNAICGNGPLRPVWPGDCQRLVPARPGGSTRPLQAVR